MRSQAPAQAHEAWCAFDKSDATVLTVHHTCMAGLAFYIFYFNKPAMAYVCIQQRNLFCLIELYSHDGTPQPIIGSLSQGRGCVCPA